MDSKSHRTRSRKGSTIVEAALIMLPFMAFVCAVIDSSLVIFMKNTVRQAAREGVRYGITGQTRTGMCQDASIKAVVQEKSAGFLAGTTGANRIQVEYYNPQTFAPAQNRPGNIVEVSIVNMPWSWIVPIWHSSAPIRINASVAGVLEAAPNGVMPCR
jgi:hypothetical protein